MDNHGVGQVLQSNMVSGGIIPSDAQREAALAKIYGSAAFLRSPVMRKLLQFLVQETLEGRGADLKAYGVAVDGLGRGPDFDPQADSYPRVQVGRLRRMLEQFYAEHGNEPDGIRLVIPNGGYQVHWLPSGQDTPEPTLLPEPRPAQADAVLWQPNRWNTLLILVLLGSFLGMAFWLGGRQDTVSLPAVSIPAPEKVLIPPPMLELSRVVAAEGADPAVARSVDRVLGDALHRSWVFNVRDGRTTAKSRNGGPSEYRLRGTLVGPRQKTLYLELWNDRQGTQIWSQHLTIVDKDSIAQNLGRSLNTIMSPFGIVGSLERRNLAGNFAPGYPCMLRYVEFYMADKVTEGVHRCLRETLELDPGYSPALAAQILMRLRSGNQNPQQAENSRRDALTLARHAVDADPYSADAAMAMTMAAYANGMCDLGRRSAMEVLERNPYDSYSYARIGVYMFQCNDKGAEAMLRKAWALDSALPAITAVPVFVAMSDRGEGKTALKLARTISVGEGYRKPGYELAMTVAHAGAGEIIEARDHWKTATKALNLGSDAAPSDVLQRIAWNPQMAARTEHFLREHGLFR